MMTQDTARATLENLYRIFTIPEAPESTLGEIDQAISKDVAGFLQTHIVALERSLEEIEASPVVASPLRLLEICATSDGGAALVVSSVSRSAR